MLKYYQRCKVIIRLQTNGPWKILIHFFIGGCNENRLHRVNRSYWRLESSFSSILATRKIHCYSHERSQTGLVGTGGSEYDSVGTLTSSGMGTNEITLLAETRQVSSIQISYGSKLVPSSFSPRALSSELKQPARRV